MLLALAYPVFPMPSPPPARSMTIPATRIILPRVAPSPTHTSTPPLSHSSTPNGAAVAGGIAAAIVIVIIAAFRYFRRRWRRTKAPSAEFIVDSEPKEAGGLKAINAQPEPSNDCRKESSDEEALGLSTMPDLPATPMGIYVRFLVHSLPFVLVYSSSWAPRIRTAQQRCPSPKTICLLGTSLPGQFLDSTKVPKPRLYWPTHKPHGYKGIVSCPQFPSHDTICMPGAFPKQILDSTKAPGTPPDKSTRRCLGHKDMVARPRHPSPKTSHIPRKSLPK